MSELKIDSLLHSHGNNALKKCIINISQLLLSQIVNTDKECFQNT